MKWKSKAILGKIFRQRYTGWIVKVSWAFEYAGCETCKGNKRRKRVFWIPFRCLITDMHEKKDAGQLNGHSSTEEYDDYVSKYLLNERECREFLKNIRLRQIYWFVKSEIILIMWMKYFSIFIRTEKQSAKNFILSKTLWKSQRSLLIRMKNIFREEWWHRFH